MNTISHLSGTVGKPISFRPHGDIGARYRIEIGNFAIVRIDLPPGSSIEITPLVAAEVTINIEAALDAGIRLADR